jgi:hypothetical protein
VSADRLGHYLTEMLVSISEVEQSERTYRALVDCYEEKYGEGTTADFKAASDPRLQKAVGDGAFFRSRATMYACAATAVMLDEQRQVKP